MPTDEEYAGIVLDLQEKMDKKMDDRAIKFANFGPVLQGLVILLTIVAFIVPCVLGFVNFDKRIDIVEVGQSTHMVRSDKRLT